MADDNVPIVVMLTAVLLIATFTFGMVLGLVLSQRDPPQPPPPCLAPIAPPMLSVEIVVGMGTVEPDTRTVVLQDTATQPQQTKRLLGSLRIVLTPGENPCGGPVPAPSEFYYWSVANDVTVEVSGSLYSEIHLSVYRDLALPVPMESFPPPEYRNRIVEFGIDTDPWTVEYQELTLSSEHYTACRISYSLETKLLES